MERLKKQILFLDSIDDEPTILTIYNNEAKRISLNILDSTSLSDDKIGTVYSDIENGVDANGDKYLMTQYKVSEDDTDGGSFTPGNNILEIKLREPIDHNININIRETIGSSWEETKSYANTFILNNFGNGTDEKFKSQNFRFHLYRIDSSYYNDNLYVIKDYTLITDEIYHSCQIKLSIQRIPFHSNIMSSYLFANSETFYPFFVNKHSYLVYNLIIDDIMTVIPNDSGFIPDTVSTSVYGNICSYSGSLSDPVNFASEIIDSSKTKEKFVSIFDYLNNKIVLLSSQDTSRKFLSVPQPGSVLKIKYNVPVWSGSNWVSDTTTDRIIYLVVETATLDEITFTQLTSNEDPLILPTPMESYHKYETTSIDMSIPYEGTDLKSQTQLSILGRTGSESISNTIRIGSSTNQNLEIIPTFAGSNYKVGDIGDFNGSVEGNYAKYEVLSINSTGGITKFRFINEGFGYILGETLTLRGNGSGDAQITLEENNIRVSLDNDINTGYLSGGFFINVEPNLICNKSTDTSQFGDNKRDIWGL